MSSAGNVAEQAENVTLWFKENLNVKEESSNNNSNYNIKFVGSATKVPPNMSPRNVNNCHDKNFMEICKKTQAGQKIMIIMRGAPGSGKSTLAKQLLQQVNLLDQHTVEEFVFSSDDYFKSQRGYEFNPTLLTEAHAWNKNRVRCTAADGWSPIIVDNTNIMVWEMQPYVQIAVQHGYIIELLEPQTAWSKSASKLSQMNVHQVPKDSIQRMLERYEKTNVAELLGLLKETKYKVTLPQLRLKPPLPALPAPSVSGQGVQISNSVSAARQDDFKLNVNTQSWVPYEKDVNNYWAEQNQQPMAAAVDKVVASSEKSLLDLLRDDPPEVTTSTVSPQSSNDIGNNVLVRHSLNCPNVQTGFVMLRQMYPNKQLLGLWDLYVKCNGDLDWAVDILLKEDELTNDETDNVDESLLASDEFKCDCSNNNPQLLTATASAVAPYANKSQPKPQRQPRAKRNGGAGSAIDPVKKELQLEIQNRFVLGDEQYSEHTRKIRDIRQGILDQPILPQLDAAIEEDDEDSEDKVLVEIDLGDQLIEQLRSIFKWEGDLLPDNLEPMPSKVFLPRSLAKQVYFSWVESAQNQLEEQRHQTMHDDEQFARLLKHPKYSECSESPDNVKELLDMELAWSIYNSEKQAKQVTRQKPNDIATHLTKMKLCEKFPDIPNDTVLQVFADTDHDYAKTVEVLDSNVKSDLTGEELYEQALRENLKLNQQEQQSPAKVASPRATSNAKTQSPQFHEEAKSAALQDFEEMRNLAAHHSQLRAECNLKAKQAIQQGNGSVAIYYSRIAQLHKKKIDIFNHRAANCIMEVHRHTQNNPDLLDLHYLHTMEAVTSLDLFLDRHITVLRNCRQAYKNIFIITGRGLHSANGVSIIKKSVKARLAERRLHWQEVNPGLLRVKVFSASRHSKNF